MWLLIHKDSFLCTAADCAAAFQCSSSQQCAAPLPDGSSCISSGDSRLVVVLVRTSQLSLLLRLLLLLLLTSFQMPLMSCCLSTADDCSSSSVCNSAYVCAVPIAAVANAKEMVKVLPLTSTFMLCLTALFDCCFSLHNEVKHWLRLLQ